MKKSAWLILVSVGAIVLIWAALFLPGADEQPAPAKPAPTESEAPTPDLVEPESPSRDIAPAAPPEAAPEPSATPTGSPSQRHAAAESPHAQQRPEKMGPFDELKATYERDGRDPEAGATEERIRKLLDQPEVTKGMVRSVSCVKTVCKLELRWNTNDKGAYMILMMSLVSNVSQKLAAAPLGEDEGQQVHSIEVYVSRSEPPLSPTPPPAN